MDQWLQGFAVLAKVLSSVPSTHMAAHRCLWPLVQGVDASSSGFCQHQGHTWCMDTQTDKVIKNIPFFMHVHMCACMCEPVHVYAWASVCVHVRACACVCMCMHVCVCVCACTHACEFRCSWRAEACDSPRVGVIGWLLELNSDPLQEQFMLIATESSLQCPTYIILIFVSAVGHTQGLILPRLQLFCWTVSTLSRLCLLITRRLRSDWEVLSDVKKNTAILKAFQ